jgi:hypothetical protein
MAKAVFRRAFAVLAAAAVLTAFILLEPWVRSFLPSGFAPAWALGFGKSAPEAKPIENPADDHLQRGQQVFVPGGVFYIPPNFHSADGHFDLLMHFHGNVELVEESANKVGLNALVYILNLGDGTRRYTDAMTYSVAFDEHLEHAVTEAKKLGLRDAKVGRIALSAWSAGYASVRQILTHHFDQIDAVLLLDSPYAPFVRGQEVDWEHLQPFMVFSEKAVAGERLFVITHSAVPTFTYATSGQATDAILDFNQLERTKSTGKPLRAKFGAALRASPNYHEGLMPSTEAHRKGFHVYGFKGDKAEHHAAHLVQMSLTVLPPLVERWQGQ